MKQSAVIAALFATTNAHLNIHRERLSQVGVRFATGMNGDEDLGQDITMKGEKFHYNQLAQGLPLCNGENGVVGYDCLTSGNYPRKLTGTPYAPSGAKASTFVSGAHSYESNGRHDYIQTANAGVDDENDRGNVGDEDYETNHVTPPPLCNATGADTTTPGVSCTRVGISPGGFAQKHSRNDDTHETSGNSEDGDTETIVAPLKCNATNADTTTPGVTCTKVGVSPGGLAQKRSRDDEGNERAGNTEENDTEAIVAPLKCNATGADTTTPGVTCTRVGVSVGGLAQKRSRDDEGNERAGNTEENDTEAIVAPLKCNATGADTTTPGVTCTRVGVSVGGLAQFVQLAPNLPKCDGGNGVFGVDCVSPAGFPEKLQQPIHIGGLVQLTNPTCDQWITTNCQPVCDRDQTTGCTEGRTPERPRRDRYEGKWTHKPQQTTIQARNLPTDGTSNTMPNPYAAAF